MSSCCLDLDEKNKIKFNVIYVGVNLFLNWTLLLVDERSPPDLSIGYENQEIIKYSNG